MPASLQDKMDSRASLAFGRPHGRVVSITRLFLAGKDAGLYYYYYYYYLKSRRGESNFISAIKSIIDADMARQQRVHGIFLKDFMLFKIDFRVPLISE